MIGAAPWTAQAAGAGFWSATRPALGTTAQVVSDSRWSAAVLELVDGVLAGMDQVASRFRADSELSRVNSDPRPEVEISPALAALLRPALMWARLTHGLLDPTVGDALVRSGYADDFGEMDKDQPDPVEQERSVPGWRLLTLHGSTLCRPPGTGIDLGATAKAQAADQAADLLGQQFSDGFLVSLGGDLAIAGTGPSGGWVVRVTDDHRSGPEDPGQTVALTAGGLATSSVTVRRWRRGGQNMHHLVDPRTGLPADGPWRTVSVAAPSCLQANALATAAVVAGAGATSILEGTGASARMVTTDGRAVHLGGWPVVGEELEPMVRSGAAA